MSRAKFTAHRFLCEQRRHGYGQLGEKVVEQLVKKKFVKNLSDIYALTRKSSGGSKDLRKNRFTIYWRVLKHRAIARWRASYWPWASNTWGKAPAELLAEAAGDMDTLAHMSEEELEEVQGVGKKSRPLSREYFGEPHHLKEDSFASGKGSFSQESEKIASH